MSLLLEIRRRARHVIGPLIGVCIAGYFAYHAIQGERGLISWLQLNQQIKAAEVTLAETAAERAALARRVALLRPDNLDRDMLEERARLILNLAGTDEVVILNGTRPPQKQIKSKTR